MSVDVFLGAVKDVRNFYKLPVRDRVSEKCFLLGSFSIFAESESVIMELQICPITSSAMLIHLILGFMQTSSDYNLEQAGTARSYSKPPYYL